MRHIIVTGVGGNVGQYVAESMSQSGYSVIGIYRNKKPQKCTYALVQADLAEEKLDLNNVGTVIHVAAGLDGSTQKLVKDNISATLNLIKFAERIKADKFIYMSTVSTYGTVKDELSLDSDIVNPSIYGSTKYIAENLVRGCDIPQRIVISLPRMLGPFVDLKNTEGSGFLTMAKKILNGENVKCDILDRQYNNYMHVSDLATFLQTLMERHEDGYSKVILAVKERLTMREILQTMKQAVQSSPEIEETSGNGSPACALISIESAKQLGFCPMSAKRTLELFMSEMNEKYRALS